MSKRRLNSLSVAAQLELNLLLRITRTFRDKFPPIRSFTSTQTEMDKLTIISGCLFLAADIFAIASVANPDWINTGESAGKNVKIPKILHVCVYISTYVIIRIVNNTEV